MRKRGGARPSVLSGGWRCAQGPGQEHEIRVVDVNGTRVVIVAMWFPATSQDDRARLDAMLDSIRIGMP
jgi:hypothetical protein